MRISISFGKKQRTPEEIKALPKFSAQTAEGVYKLTDVIYIDNVEGMGQTPDNQSVLYKGFMSTLPLALFGSMTLPSRDKGERAEPLIERILAGYGIGCPCLYINIDGYLEEGKAGEPTSITGHEGRARAVALQKLGLKEIPVQFMFQGYRARNIKPDLPAFTKYLNAGLMDENGKLHTDIFDKLVVG